jgi:hypothetical protein
LQPGASRQLTQVVAQCLSTGATYDRLIIPRSGMPSAILLKHMRIDEHQYASACAAEAFADDWRAFVARCAPTPLFAAWNQGSLDLVAAELDEPPSRLSLKSAYRGVHGADLAELSEIISHHALTPTPGPFRGRAAERLPNAVAVARYLHERIQAG